MTVQTIGFIAVTAALAGFLALVLSFTATHIGYDYGSPKRILSAVGMSVVYTVALGIVATWATPIVSIRGSLYFLVFSVVSTISIASSFVDLKYREIPDSFNLITAFLGFSTILLFPGLASSAIIGAGAFFGIYFVIMAVTGAMGGGDVKMVGALGSLIPLSHFGHFLVSPFLFGSVSAVYLIFIKKQDPNGQIAFGPYITCGFLTTTLAYWSILM